MNRTLILPRLNLPHHTGMILASVIEQIAEAIAISYGFEALSLYLVHNPDGFIQGVGIGNIFCNDSAVRTAVSYLEEVFASEPVSAKVFSLLEGDTVENPIRPLINESIRQLGVVRVDLPNLGDGYIFVGNTEQRHVNASEFTSDVRKLSLHAGNLMEPLNILQDYQKQFSQMHELSMLEIAVNGSTSLETSMDLMLGNGRSIFSYDAAVITIFNPVSLHLDYLAGYGIWGANDQSYSIRLGSGLAGQAALERRIIGVEAHQEPSQPQFVQQLIQQERMNFHYAIPIEAKGSLKGVLEVFYRHSPLQNENWYNLLEVFVSKLGGIIFDAEVVKENQKLYLELETAYDAICRTWMHEIETYLQEPMGHTEFLANMTVQLGRRCGLGREELTNIYRGVLLHDIGMLRIPSGVISRPGRFDDESLKLIQMHPLYAYDQLGTIDRLKPAMEIPLHHHERWNGSGYPFQLQSEQIPLAARLFAVVDVWDAMQSPRPHRSAIPHSAVRGYLLSQGGKLFDPEIVNIFLETLPTQTVGDRG